MADLSQAQRAIRAVLTELRAAGYRPTNPGARRVGWYSWVGEQGRTRIVVDAHASDLSARLVICQQFAGGFTATANCEFGAWQTAIGILAAYHLISEHHTSAYRTGYRHGRATRNEARHG